MDGQMGISFSKELLTYPGLLGKLRGWKNSRIISSFDLSIKWIKASGNQIELAKTLLELARYHVSLSNYEKARATISAVAKIVSPGRLDLIPDDLRPLVKELGFQENTADQLLHSRSSGSRAEERQCFSNITTPTE
jgi:hypothetical protein